MQLNIHTSKKEEFIDITDKISELINLKTGICVLYCPHTTAAITINEGADPSVKKDILSILTRIVPDNFNYQHLEGNSPAHVKSSLMGNSGIVLVKDKKLLLGKWQSIFFCEFDGPRTRKVFVKFNKFLKD